MEKVWLKTYKEYGLPPEVTLPPEHTSLLDIFEDSFKKYAKRDAFVFMDKRITYGELDTASLKFAAYLQSLNLSKEARVAVMLPNVLQYPVAAIGVIRAGYTLVNVNPLYTARELEHQLKDSGAEVLVILENFAHTFEDIFQDTPVKHVIIASVGDMLGTAKGLLVNLVLRHVRKQVPAYDLWGHVKFNQVLQQGNTRHYQRPQVTMSHIALLQYTGGTTGVSKGAELTHKNLSANLFQCDALFQSAMGDENAAHAFLCALPLYHIFAFMVCALYGMHNGHLNVLIANPRDINALVDEIAKYKPQFIPAVNTLFNALVNHERFKTLDFSHLMMAMGGGMSVLPATAKAWHHITGKPIIEGYGLSETSPVAVANPPSIKEYTGAIGVPIPSTEVVLLDDDSNPVAMGERGEIAIRGPQVMRGYWLRPEATQEVMTEDGFFKTGDIGVMDEKGFIKIVDRKKDMILVSGFNVYPNEIEEVITQHPKVLEAAAIGVPDAKSGEVPKLFIVKRDPSLSEAEVLTYCHDNLTGYKRPKYVEFMSELPKSNVGKILRKELRK